MLLPIYPVSANEANEHSIVLQLTICVLYESVVPKRWIASTYPPMAWNFGVLMLRCFTFASSFTESWVFMTFVFVFAACRLPRAMTSFLNSWVLYAMQVDLMNRRTCRPSSLVASSRSWRVVLVCTRNFASACQVARENRRSSTFLLWRLLVRISSNTGQEHYDEWLNRHMIDNIKRGRIIHTWRISSKSRAASFFIAAVLSVKRLIVSVPNVGTKRNLTIKFGKYYLHVSNIQNCLPFIEDTYRVTSLRI